MIAAVVNPKPEYPRYRLTDPEAMHLGEIFELRHLDTEVAQLRLETEIARVRSFTREYFDTFFIQVPAP